MLQKLNYDSYNIIYNVKINIISIALQYKKNMRTLTHKR